MIKLMVFSIFLCLTAVSTLAAQGKYFSKTAVIAFDAEGKLDDVEDIKAKTNLGTCVYDANTGNFEWIVSVKTFVFANSLMQEHFNENYLETEKYPKASFKGKVENFSEINLKKDGSYPVKVVGKLTMHGVSKDISVSGKFVVAKNQISTSSNLEVALKDYNITVPTIVMMKVAEIVKISINTDLQALK